MRKVIVFLIFICLSVTQLTESVFAAPAQPPFTPSCNAIYVVNADTGTVVYQKNATTKVYPASLTKMMTAILTVEKFKNNLDEKVTITHEDTDPLIGSDGSSADLRPGEELTIRQLLYCLLVKSADESANALARLVAGSIDDFVPLMNAKAKEIGAKNTNYVNAHGLHDPNHFTTAYDTYLIAKYAMQYDIIKTIVGTGSYDMAKTNKHAARTFTNTNNLLNTKSIFYYKYVQGIKTGHTTPAGDCLASYATKGVYTYYCIAMGGPKKTDTATNVAVNLAFSDTKAIYQWAFSTFVLTPLVQKQEPQVAVMKVDLAWQKNKIKLYPEKDFIALVPKNSDLSKVKVVSHVPASIQAPVKEGQVIGTADVSYDGQKMGTIKLVSNEAVSLSQPLYFLYIAGIFFSSKWFKLLCVILVLAFSIYILLVFFMSRKKSQLNRRQGKRYKFK
jgi:D-alanyl-D-alanine carboxypeptidase (penicillin-binding protein 5/6)